MLLTTRAPLNGWVEGGRRCRTAISPKLSDLPPLMLSSHVGS